MGFVALCGRFTLASLFLLAGAAKLPRLAEFESAVRNYRLLPGRLVHPASVALPVGELAAGLLLALGFVTPAVAIAVAGLLVVFAAAVSVNLARGRSIDCGCFGSVAAKRITWATVARNLALAGLGVVVAAEAPRALALDAAIFGAAGAVSSSQALAVAIATTAALAAVALASAALRYRSLVERGGLS
jgi:uncharacterized membrane protein YphA (DoxX/SURF4 family)